MQLEQQAATKDAVAKKLVGRGSISNLALGRVKDRPSVRGSAKMLGAPGRKKSDLTTE